MIFYIGARGKLYYHSKLRVIQEPCIRREKNRPSWPMLSISRFVHVCVYLFVRVFTFEVPFKRLFAPTFQSRMSKKFRDSESLEKSNGKKWFNILKLLLIKGVKFTRILFFFLANLGQLKSIIIKSILQIQNFLAFFFIII